MLRNIVAFCMNHVGEFWAVGRDYVGLGGGQIRNSSLIDQI